MSACPQTTSRASERPCRTCGRLMRAVVWPDNRITDYVCLACTTDRRPVVSWNVLGALLWAVPLSVGLWLGVVALLLRMGL